MRRVGRREGMGRRKEEMRGGCHEPDVPDNRVRICQRSEVVSAACSRRVRVREGVASVQEGVSV